MRAARQNRRRGKPGIQCTAHIFGMGRQKQMAAKCGQVRIGTAPANERGAGNIQAVMLDRIEHAQAGVGTVARHQHHFDAGPAQAGVKAQELLDQREGIAGLEGFFLVLDLVLAVSLYPFGQVDLVTVTQVEQCTRDRRRGCKGVVWLWQVREVAEEGRTGLRSLCV